MPTPAEAEAVVDRYFEAWNHCQTDEIVTLTADPVIRHYAGKTVAMGHDEQVARIRKRHEQNPPVFEAIIRHSDGIYVTTIWNNSYRDGRKTCGSETFKVVDGVITDVWNPLSIDEGHWADDHSDSAFEIPDGFATITK